MLQSETPLETKANTETPNSSADSVKTVDGTTESKPLSLAELFKDADDTDASAEGNDSTPIESIDGVAKRLKLTPEQVYALKVPMKDHGEPLTIGTLKDRVGELVDLETREMQFDQRRVKQEGELLRSQTEMREILSMLPKDAIKPELLRRLREQNAAKMEHEHTATLALIPEWESEQKRTVEFKGMADHLSEYGFPESFLSTVADHRALKYIRDNYLRDKRIKDALARVTNATKPGNKRPSAKMGKAPVRPNSQSTSTRQRGTPDMRANLMNLFKASE